jgi:hypothetical protein
MGVDALRVVQIVYNTAALPLRKLVDANPDQLWHPLGVIKPDAPDPKKTYDTLSRAGGQDDDVHCWV